VRSEFPAQMHKDTQHEVYLSDIGIQTRGTQHMKANKAMQCDECVHKDAIIQTNLANPKASELHSLQLKYQGTGAFPSDNLHPTGIPATVNSDALTAMFTIAGFDVKRARIIFDPKRSLITRYCAGIVQLGSQQEAAVALDILSGQILGAVGGLQKAKRIVNRNHCRSNSPIPPRRLLPPVPTYLAISPPRPTPCHSSNAIDTSGSKSLINILIWCMHSNCC
jgi:hypothetical protein